MADLEEHGVISQSIFLNQFMKIFWWLHWLIFPKFAYVFDLLDKKDLFQVWLFFQVQYVRYMGKEDDPSSAIGRGWASTYSATTQGTY